MTAPDLLITGGGAAGLSAASTASALGLSVEIVDERPAPGGNFYAGVAEAGGNAGLGDDYARGAGLLAGARNANWNVGTFAWRVEQSGQTFVVSEKEPVRSITPKRLLVATGAMERPVPLPGGTLPGVMYAGAAQLMLKSAKSVPAGRFVLVGGGPLLLLLATQLLARGVRPLCIIETTRWPGIGASVASLPAALNAPGLLLKGLGMVRRLRQAGIAWHHRASAVSIEGTGKAERVVFTDDRGDRQSVETDLVLLHDGVVPNDQVTRQLGCTERWNAEQHCFNPVIGQWGETSRAGIFAAGDCTGIWGARAAELAGEVAVLEIARQLGKIDVAERDRRAADPLRDLARERAFRPFLERHSAPSLAPAGKAAADAVVCRCENVTAGAIREAVAHGATGPGQLKSFTRCGMGPCQGRNCALAAAEIIAAEVGCSIEAVGRHDIRSPLKPLPLGKVAAAAALEPAP